MAIKLNFSEQEGGDFTPLPAGEYPCTIFEVKLSPQPGQSGFHYLAITFKLKDNDRRLWRNYSLSPKALWALRELLAALGIDVPEGEDFNLDEKQLLGKAVVCGVTETVYQGKPGNEVTSVVAGSAGSWS